MDTPVETKRRSKRADNNRTAQPHNEGIHKWPEELIEMWRKRAETLNVFSEQVDRNVRPWQRNTRPNAEAPLQINKTVEKLRSKYLHFRHRKCKYLHLVIQIIQFQYEQKTCK